MSAHFDPQVTALGAWNFGPVRVWHLPHQAKTRGEIRVRPWLAKQLGFNEDTLPLSRDSHDRPQLGKKIAHWDCNWSHSGEHLLLALGKNVRLGVDLERQRPRRNLRETIERFFHPKEILWLNTLSDANCEAAFFRLWCAKEAVLKAHGQGLSFGLHKLCLFPRTGGLLQLVSCDEALGSPSQWHLQQWQPLEGYQAALAWYETLQTGRL